MVRRLHGDGKCYSFLGTRKENKKTIVVGLKSDTRSKDMLLQLLDIVADAGDDILGTHVQESFDTFDPNSFHVHEDFSKSKQVDFQVKICRGVSYVAELCNQVRVNRATILALGCNISGPKEQVVSACLKGLPPTCNLVVIDSAGRIRFQKQGTSQQGTTSGASQSSPSSSIDKTCFKRRITTCQPEKSSASSVPSLKKNREIVENLNVKMLDDPPEFQENNLSNRFVLLEEKGWARQFTLQELRLATNDFSLDMVIGEGGNSRVYRAILMDGNAAAVKVLKTTRFADLLREVEILSGVKHKNIVQIIGYCGSEEKPAIVYNLLKGSLSQYLRKLNWSERMGVALGVAKALKHLHHSLDPPIIHRDVKSSNILLSDDYQPQLSDFEAAISHHQSEKISMMNISFDVVGTFGYLAPEYVMYGKVDEKLDVYSYGVVLLELITGKDAIQTNQSNCESLVLWARSLLSSGLWERLIDPHLNEDYNKEEMEMMMFTARLCLIHSPSRRPTMKKILKLFEDPENWIKMRKDRDEFLCGMSSKDDWNDGRQDDLSSTATSSTDNMDTVSLHEE